MAWGRKRDPVREALDAALRNAEAALDASLTFKYALDFVGNAELYKQGSKVRFELSVLVQDIRDFTRKLDEEPGR